MHPTPSGFVEWQAKTGRPARQAMRHFAKWHRSGGWLETSVKLPGHPLSSRRLRWHLPFPSPGDAYDDADREGGERDWFVSVVERMKKECPGFLLSKASVERRSRFLEYDSNSRHVFCMLRAFAEYWGGRVPPDLNKDWIDALPDAVVVANVESEEEEEEEKTGEGGEEGEEEDNESEEEEEEDDREQGDAVAEEEVAEEEVAEEEAAEEEAAEEEAAEEEVAEEEVAEERTGPQSNPTHVVIGCGQHRLRVPIRNLCLGSLLMGDPGSGKTQMAKHVFERIVGQVPTVTSHVVLDWKGDFRQLAFAARHAPADDPIFADVEFVTYTFNRDADDGVSTPVTLDPFFYVDELVAIDRATTRGAFLYAKTLSRIAFDVLSGTIRMDADLNTCLDTCANLPVMATMRSQYGGGVNKKDDRSIASALHSSLMAVLTKVHDAGVPLPRTYASLFEEVRCAFDARTSDGTPATPIVEGLVKREDMDALSIDVQTRIAAYDPRSNLYVPDAVPLNAHTFFDPSARSKRTKVSIVALGYSFGDDVFMEAHKKTVVSTVLSRILSGASAYGTDDARPHAAVYLDEASCYLGKKSPLVETVTKLLKVHRDKGVALLFATQRPNDLSPDVRSMVGGMRLVGKFAAEEREKVALLSNIVKNKAARKPIRDALDSLRAHEFLGLTTETGSEIVRVRAPSRLKRLHEASALWNGEGA